MGSSFFKIEKVPDLVTFYKNFEKKAEEKPDIKQFFSVFMDDETFDEYVSFTIEDRRKKIEETPVVSIFHKVMWFLFGWAFRGYHDYKYDKIGKKMDEEALRDAQDREKSKEEGADHAGNA